MSGLPPTFVLAILVGALHASLSLFLRGSLRLHLLVVLPCAVAGAVAGAAAGLRAPDPVRIGDLAVLWASAGAWVGIALAVPLRLLLGRLRRPVAPRGPRGTDASAAERARPRLPRPHLPRRARGGPRSEA
ncbi:MAG: hypothetical protein ACKOTZ_00720 [Chloroflexota bacterium]